ncbi:hypothetical protein SAMN02745910_03491 [Priestia endophytica DSM 13796]|jgi:FtsH-binding integral membrane protein|uniref:Uncharacterized protein n=1 Tax=Priestia endophytica DSM 13796 TaxID=1121089 RepID=A0A1I6BDF3_9BACI|nr:hypothetical protein SAMN02745910_03491 [Priestia endophytica DSM 13796]
MARRYNLWSFYLCLICLIFSLSLVFSDWSVAPPVYILWIFTLVALILGLFGFEDETNKRSRLRSLFTFIFSSLLLLILFLVALRVFFVSEDLFKTTHSPNNNYKIEFYLTNGGATTSFGVLGKLDGPLWFEKTVYDDYRMDHADVKWINNHTFSINNHILDLKKGETYSE